MDWSFSVFLVLTYWKYPSVRSVKSYYFISDVKMCSTSHWPIIFNISQFLRMRVTNNLAVREEYYNTCHQERISCIWNTRPDARACRIHQDFSLQLSCRMSYWCNNLQTIIYIKYCVLNIHGVLNIAYMEIGLGLWCLTPLSTIFQ